MPPVARPATPARTRTTPARQTAFRAFRARPRIRRANPHAHYVQLGGPRHAKAKDLVVSAQTGVNPLRMEVRHVPRAALARTVLASARTPPSRDANPVPRVGHKETWTKRSASCAHEAKPPKMALPLASPADWGLLATSRATVSSVRQGNTRTAKASTRAKLVPWTPTETSWVPRLTPSVRDVQQGAQRELSPDARMHTPVCAVETQKCPQRDFT